MVELALVKQVACAWTEFKNVVWELKEKSQIM